MLTLILMSQILMAQEPQFFVNDKQATKVQAVIALAQDPNANVVKCQQQELSDKATLRNKKVPKK